MMKKYILIAHYADSTATILAFDSIAEACCHFDEEKMNPSLCFAILYSEPNKGAGYISINSYVNADQRNAYEYTLLGFDR